MLGKDLQKILERVHPGFAYEMLSLQIQLDMQSESQTSRIQSITRLIQLYMAAVQALQGKCDNRYKYFSSKIQLLMKKKHVVQQLHIASTGRTADQTALQQVHKAQIGQRRNQLDLQIFLNKQQIDAKKIRQLVKNADNKLRTFERNVQKNLRKQDQALQERKRLRKLKSDAGSVSRFNVNRDFQSPNSKYVMKTEKELDDYFAINIDKRETDKRQIKKRSGSIQKKETQTIKFSTHTKLKGYIV